MSTLQGCGGLEKILEFNIFYFGRVSAVLKELILTVSTLGGFGSLESTDF